MSKEELIEVLVNSSPYLTKTHWLHILNAINSFPRKRTHTGFFMGVEDKDGKHTRVKGVDSRERIVYEVYFVDKTETYEVLK